MFRGFRLVVSVHAALPINPQDGEAVFNYRGSIPTGHFLGQLFRTLGQVLNVQPTEQQDGDNAEIENHQIVEAEQRVLTAAKTSSNAHQQIEVRAEGYSHRQQENIEPDFHDRITESTFKQHEAKEEAIKVNKKDDTLTNPLGKEDITHRKGVQPTCQILTL